MTTRNFPFVNAIYRSATIEDHKGNPYIEALPALPDDATLAQALTYMPSFDPRERLSDASHRIQRLAVLNQILIALPRVVRLARAMLKMIIAGYAARPPHSTQESASLQSLYALQQSGTFVSAAQKAVAAQLTMALIGASGCGKSFTLNHIAKLLPPAIYHEALGKWQLPLLTIEMSWDGESVNAIASALYHAIQLLLPDGNYVETYTQRSKFNAEQRLANAFLVARGLGVGQIVIDESQNQRSIGNEPAPAGKGGPSKRKDDIKKETPLTKLLITASNTSKIPLLFTGTLEMNRVVGTRFTRSRRMAGHGSARWYPLEPPTGDPERPGEFDILVMGFLKFQWTRKPIVYSKEWVDLFYELTQGIADIFVKLFSSSQEAAIANGSEILTPDLVRVVATAEFAEVAFGIDALRTRDPVMLDAVPDLYAEQLPIAKPAKASTRASAKQQPPEPTPIPFDSKLLAQADIRLDKSGKAPGGASGLTLGSLTATAT